MEHSCSPGQTEASCLPPSVVLCNVLYFTEPDQIASQLSAPTELNTAESLFGLVIEGVISPLIFISLPNPPPVFGVPFF